MKTIKEQFIPYDLAVKLKELGFDEPCLFFYNLLEDNKLEASKFYSSDDYLDAPLWQQAFYWFMEKHELMNHLTTHLNTWGEDGALEESYGYRIMFNKDGWKCEVWDKLSRFDTYEEGQLECLKKLIEIVEEKL